MATVQEARVEIRERTGKNLFSGTRGWALLVLPALVLLFASFGLPLARIIYMSFSEPEPTWANFREFFTEEVYLRVLWNTVRLSLTATVLTALIAYPYAFLMARSKGGMRTFLMACVLLPMWTNTLVRSFAWMLMLNDTGIINGLLQSMSLTEEPFPLIRTPLGVAIGMTHVLLPYMVLPMYASISALDPSLPRAAAGMGAGPLSVLVHVVLPLTRSGILGGCLLVFVMSLGFYITPALLGSPDAMVLSQMINEHVNGTLNWGMAAACAVVLLGLTLLLLAVAGRFVRVGGLLSGQAAVSAPRRGAGS